LFRSRYREAHPEKRDGTRPRRVAAHARAIFSASNESPTRGTPAGFSTQASSPPPTINCYESPHLLSLNPISATAPLRLSMLGFGRSAAFNLRSLFNGAFPRSTVIVREGRNEQVHLEHALNARDSRAERARFRKIREEFGVRSYFYCSLFLHVLTRDDLHTIGTLLVRHRLA